MKTQTMNLAIVFLPLFFTFTIQSPFSPPHFHFLKQNSTNETIQIPPQEYFQLTLPLPTDDIPPACSVTVLNHTVTGDPPVSVNYTPPPDTCKWSVVVLDFRAECKGDQLDGIAGVWIAGVELLRTSTARPTEDGIFWNVRKDVTKYSSIFAQQNLTLTAVFQNLMNYNFSDVFNVNLSFHFYSDDSFSAKFEEHSLNRKLISVKSYENEENLRLNRVIKSSYPYDGPADLIIPVSEAPDEGFWFKIHNQSDVKTIDIQISEKTYKAVLELYVSVHGDDEFWYMNPPEQYIKANGLPITSGKGAYREVLVTIDGKLVGSVIPFPVITPDGINPLFWKPVVSIGAFDHPSYDIDLTSHLGFLRDNRNHSIGFQVADGNSFWLLAANLHIWTDDRVVQSIVDYEPPSMEIEQEHEFKGLDGEFETEVKRSTSSIRWEVSSNGVLETKVTDEIKFKNKLKFKHHGPYGIRKELEQKIRRKTKIKMTSRGYTVGESVIEKVYPLKIVIESGGSRVNTTVVQGRKESFSDEMTSVTRVLNHDMNCSGWMVMKGNVVSGSTENRQSYSYNDGESGCYSRNVDAVDGDVVADETRPICVG